MRTCGTTITSCDDKNPGVRWRRAAAGAALAAALGLAGLGLAGGSDLAQAKLTIVGEAGGPAVSASAAADGEVGGLSSAGSSGSASSAADASTASTAVAMPDLTGRAPITADQIADGDYDIDVASSSSMFRIVSATLHVQDGAMTCTMTMSGTGYGKLFMGTGEQAEKASEQDLIPFEETEGGTHAFTVPVDALDQETPCAAWSIKKEQWYDRTLVFLSDKVPGEAVSDGASADAESARQASVTLSGGSGRATVASPAQLEERDGQLWATVVWSSPNYDLMTVDGVDYQPVTTDPGSTFTIPVAALDQDLPVSARTTAMGTPHTIDYTLRFSLTEDGTAGTTDSEDAGSTASSSEDAGSTAASSQNAGSADTSGSASQATSPLAGRDTGLGIGWAPTSTMDTAYATQFAVDYYEGGYKLLSISNGGRFLLVPQGAAVPEGLSSDIAVLQAPLSDLYVAASSSLCLFDALDAVDSVGVLGVRPESVSVESFTRALDAGSLAFGGTYSSPDYELLLARGCPLAVESAMITHAPDVREKLESLGIPVLIEASSYEESPMGRLEWIRFFGALLDREDAAKAYFDQQVSQVEAIAAQEASGKTVAIFSIGSDGKVSIYSPEGYMAQMVRLAGGTYAFDGVDAGGASTVKIDPESFFAMARDADVLVYNGTIDGGVSSLAELEQLNATLAGFKAVSSGDVWCIDHNMYQQMTGTAQIVDDYHAILTDADSAQPAYLVRLE